MSSPTHEVGSSTNLTDTGDVTTVDADLIGFYVNSTSSGVIALRRGGSGGTVLGGNVTPAAGFHRFPVSCPGGIHLTKVSGTIDVTVFFVPR